MMLSDAFGDFPEHLDGVLQDVLKVRTQLPSPLFDAGSAGWQFLRRYMEMAVGLNGLSEPCYLLQQTEFLPGVDLHDRMAQNKTVDPMFFLQDVNDATPAGFIRKRRVPPCADAAVDGHSRAFRFPFNVVRTKCFIH